MDYLRKLFQGEQGATAPKPTTPARPLGTTATATTLPNLENADLLLAGGRKRRTRRRGGFALQNPNVKAGAPPTGAAGTLGGRRTRKHKGKGKKHTRRRRGGNTPLPPTKSCDYDSKCSHSDNGKHDWGLVGRGNYVCQNKCGCYFDDR